MKLDTRLDALGDHLERSVAADLRTERRAAAALAPGARRARPRLLAGSTLGLAGVGTAIVLALGGTTATQPAFAVTRGDDGSVLVQLHNTETLGAANDKLAAMGIHEKFMIWSVPGPATASGPVTCQKTPGSSPSGPPIKVLVGNDGTEVGGSDNTGAGAYHLRACYYENADFSGNSGIPGAG